MRLQLMGSVLILGAALWIGAALAARERYRLQDLEELERCILLLQGQIAYLAAPLPEIMESIGRKAESSIGRIFQETAERMARRCGSSAEEIWQEIWQEKAPQTYLSKEDREAVRLFGKTLDCAEKSGQEGGIQLLLRYLAQAQTLCAKRLEKNGRLYLGVSGLSGLLLIVTLL